MRIDEPKVDYLTNVLFAADYHTKKMAKLTEW